MGTNKTLIPNTAEHTMTITNKYRGWSYRIEYVKRRQKYITKRNWMKRAVILSYDNEPVATVFKVSDVRKTIAQIGPRIKK